MSKNIDRFVEKKSEKKSIIHLFFKKKGNQTLWLEAQLYVHFKAVRRAW